MRWLPDYAKPSPPTRPVAAVVSMTRYERVQDWVSRHKILTGVIIITCGTVIFKGYQTNRSMRKTRRAKRARNGGRTEVVVIAGSPTLPLTKSLSLDMERRGFIVYIVCNATEDENMVHSLSRPDIRPLGIDTTNVSITRWSSTPAYRFANIRNSASSSWRCHRALCNVFAVSASSRASHQTK